MVADGDRMGATLEQIGSPNAHQEFSKQVAVFAEHARQVVLKYEGYLVYCGGDDVLALLPANRALECAHALREGFAQILKPAMPAGLQPTLSAGIAIVHAMDNLQVALGWAREAEQLAKRIRNALAVARHPRSGGVNRYRAPWQRYPEWEGWIQAFHHGLADGFPYELRQLVKEYRPLNPEAKLIRGEAQRVLERKQKPAATPPIPDWIDTVDALDEFAEMLLIARFLAGYMPKEKQS
ncbi:MAG: type III-B CRISPR-associated protein Cas10/Cmr2 [Fimbriimonadales bacterium]|nr:type III-B CRISPR-associated protein Cas10/Cmr2 [Fimbriimonadales bacterium]